MRYLLLLVAILSHASSLVGKTATELTWRELPPIPNSIGVAGPFAGTHQGTLIVAGGANFPERMPWDGGTKVWQRTIYTLSSSEGQWQVAGELPSPLAYGVSISTAEGLVCIGGSDSDRHHASCFRLSIRRNQIDVEPLPSLPRPLANGCGTLLDGVIYVAGGTESPESTVAMRQLWALDLNAVTPEWKELDPWPGPGRMLAVAGVQDRSLYLLSGATLFEGPDGKPRRMYLADAYRFKPGSGWNRIADLPRPAVAAPSPTPTFGQSTFLVIGGDDGSLVNHQPLVTHPGFPRSVLAYHTITDTWKMLDDAPASPVTTPCVTWNGGNVIPSGEVRPGVRTDKVKAITSTIRRTSFGVLNYSLLAAYLAVMVFIGVRCSKRNQNTDDFFRGGQRIPWWAAGLSIFATMLSSITFMAIPAAAYTSGWNLFLANSYILITPLVVFVFLPFYRRLNVTSAYEYLELRFNLATRLLGSLLFMVYQCGRVAIVLYLPSLALSTVSDLGIETCILAMGILCVLYTVTGGIEAVIWTDVVQAFILMGGALVSLLFLLSKIDGGVSETIRVAAEHQRFFETVRWDFDLAIASGWVIVIGSLFHNLLSYTASQDVVQRYVTTKDEKTAARGIWLNAIVAVPAQAVFFAIGTALFVFYHQSPSRLDISLQNDAIFPYFVMSELPAGLAGLIVAGIFAASQSTLSSSMNSIATAYVTDFHRRLRPQVTDQACLRAARVVTVLVGVIGISVAILMARTDIRSFYSTFLEILGIFGGTLSGLFILGMFTARANGPGAIVGALASAMVVFSIRMSYPLNVYAYAPIGMGVCCVVGWCASFLFAPSDRSLSGLTIATSRRRLKGTTSKA